MTRRECLQQRLEKLMAEQDYTVKQLSKDSGARETSIYRYLKGETAHPDAFMVAKLARCLGTGVDYLIGTMESDIVDRVPAELALASA